MADPTVQTFCCRQSNVSEGDQILLSFNSDEYNIVCSISSCVGILGAIYQLLPREEMRAHNRWVSFPVTRSRQIVMWLATADLLASLGVFTRSMLWLNFKTLVPSGDDLASTLFCSITSAWVQYFYMVTWMWTLCYAVDIKLVLRERQGKPWLYHLISWLLPALLTGVGLSILYVPNANCHNMDSNVYARILPNYCATYIPIATVMIINPFLYMSSSNDVKLMAVRTLSQFTSKERSLVDAIRVKFFAINAAFYICWLPNLINGVLLWSLWFSLPVKVLTSLWYIMASGGSIFSIVLLLSIEFSQCGRRDLMTEKLLLSSEIHDGYCGLAVTNPLQALLNSLVYRRWKGQPQRLYIPCRQLHHSVSSSCSSPRAMSSRRSSNKEQEIGESTPLLRSNEGLRGPHNTSINGCTAT